jgi:hypothetical protein
MEVGLLLQALNMFRKALPDICGACSCDCEQVCGKGVEPTSYYGCGAALETYESFSAF